MHLMSPKVVGIGFHKTGTSSLAVALTELGYRVCGVRQDLAPHLTAGDLDPVYAVLDDYDAFRDNPWPLLYPQIDRRHPGTRFVLTIRDEDPWIASAVNHFGAEDTPLRTWIYGVGHPLGHEDTYRERYRTHNEQVRAYFRDRPGDLLVVDWSKGDGWAELCRFLDVPCPDRAFPHENRRSGLAVAPRPRGGGRLGRWLHRGKPHNQGSRGVG